MSLFRFVPTVGLISMLAAPSTFSDNEQNECTVLVTNVPGSIPLPYGCHTSGAAIDSTVDLDAFSFHGEAGDEVWVNADQVSDNCLGLQVEVFGPNNFHQSTSCQPICCFGCTTSCSVFLPVSLIDSGDYVVLVSDPGADQTGLYTLQIERVFPAPAVPALAYGVNPSSSIDPTTDQDYFPFFGQAGSLVNFSVNQTSFNCMGLALEVFDPTGASVLSTSCQPICCFGCSTSCSLSNNLALTTTGNYLVVVSDPDRDQGGTFNISINCILGCPPLTSTSVRNGSGVNAACYVPTCPPVIGGRWCAKVDASGNPGAIITSIRFYGSPHTGLPSPYGEILVDLTSANYCHSTKVLVSPATENTHCQAVPPSAALAGFHFSSQAFSVALGPPAVVQLCNAIDYVVGY